MKERSVIAAIGHAQGISYCKTYRVGKGMLCSDREVTGKKLLTLNNWK